MHGTFTSSRPLAISFLFAAASFLVGSGQPRWMDRPFFGLEPVGNHAIHILDLQVAGNATAGR